MSKISDEELAGNLVRICIPLSAPNARPYVDFELSLKEFGAIGRFHVQWAYFEDVLRWAIEQISGALDVEIPDGANQDSFRKRLRAYREVVSAIPDEQERRSFQKIADRAANANSFRQKMAHGVWGYDLSQASRLHVSKNSNKGNESSLLDVEKIVKVGSEVGKLTFQLLHPGGYEDFLEKHAKQGYSVSRDFVRLLQGESIDEVLPSMKKKNEK